MNLTRNIVAGLAALLIGCATPRVIQAEEPPKDVPTSVITDPLDQLGYEKTGITKDGRAVGCATSRTPYGSSSGLRSKLEGQFMAHHGYSPMTVSFLRTRSKLSQDGKVRCTEFPGKFPENKGKRGNYDATCEIEMYAGNSDCLVSVSPSRENCHDQWNSAKRDLHSEENYVKRQCYTKKRTFGNLTDCLDVAIKVVDADARFNQLHQDYEGCMEKANKPYTRCLGNVQTTFRQCLDKPGGITK